MKYTSNLYASKCLNKFSIFSILLILNFGHSDTGAPRPPSLIAPLNNSINISTNPTLSWSTTTGTTSYILQVSTQSDFSVVIYSKEFSGTSQVLFGIFNGTPYYWRVCSKSSFGQSGWSSSSFITKLALTTNGNHLGPTDVGIWYTPVSTGSGNFLPLGPAGQYSIPDYSSSATNNFYLTEIANAKIDFLIFDNTNGGFTPSYGYNSGPNEQTTQYVKNSGLMAGNIKIWNASHNWKMKYVQAIGYWSTTDSHITNRIYMKGLNDANGLTVNDYNKDGIAGDFNRDAPGSFNDVIERQAKEVYANFVQNANYGGVSSYYFLEGKPLLIIFAGADEALPIQLAEWYSFAATSAFENSYTNKFTVRIAKVGEKGTYGWPPLGGLEEFKLPNAAGTRIDDEVELVSPGYIVGGVNYIERKGGDFYRNNCWSKVLSTKRPTVLVIASFNDYDENTATWTAKSTSSCISPCRPWLDVNGIEQPNMYWDMTKSYINRLRGITATNISSNLLLLQ